MRRMQPPCLTDDEGETKPLPYRFEICSICEGHGRSSAYLGAFTADEMAQQGPDFHDDYMAGRYDRACEPCDGTGKVMVADHSRMTAAQREAWELECQLEAEDEAEREAERRMGC